jgi:ribosome-associated protein
VADKSQLDEKSRTQAKRDYRALKELAIALASSSKGQLAALPLSDETRAAAVAAQGMARNTLHRHYRDLSGLIAEDDVAAIRAALTGQLQPKVTKVAKQHEAERLRDELLSGDERALAALAADYPECDRGHVRLLVRNARKELDLDKPPRSARLLYRYLRRLTDPQV